MLLSIMSGLALGATCGEVISGALVTAGAIAETTASYVVVGSGVAGGVAAACETAKSKS